ncbi:MAG: hypothetical protein ACHQZQ_02045 [SAR324 cluster bacterium]
MHRNWPFEPAEELAEPTERLREAPNPLSREAPNPLSRDAQTAQIGSGSP